MDERKEKEKFVKATFDRISGQYDAANNRISLGMQKKWKEELVCLIDGQVPEKGTVLDVCCGTGDIAASVAKKRRDVEVYGLDFSSKMLGEARKKHGELDNIFWKKGNAMELPFRDGFFSAAVISFGLRNTANFEQVLREIERVVRPGGFVCLLDSFVPDSSWIRPAYWLYFKWIMPVLGGGRKYYQMYNWLCQSTREFLTKTELKALFCNCGFRSVACKSYLFGSCGLHYGWKPEE